MHGAKENRNVLRNIRIRMIHQTLNVCRLMEIDVTLPTLHEADGEMETSMHEHHAHKPRTTTKRARPEHDDSTPSHPSHHQTMHDTDYVDYVNLDDEDDVHGMGAGNPSTQFDVLSPPELPEDGSIPLLETQAGVTQTQVLEEHITQATADVYDALQQLQSEQVRPQEFWPNF